MLTPRAVAFNSAVSQRASAAVAPVGLLAGAASVATMRSGTTLYPSTLGSCTSHDADSGSVAVAKVGSRTRSPDGAQIHSATTVSDVDSGQAAVDSGGSITTMLALPAPLDAVVVITDE